MNDHRLERGLTRTFTAVIAIMLTVVALPVSLVAYAVQVRQIATDCQESLGMVGTILPLYPTPQFEPRAKVDVIMTHLFRPDLFHPELVVVLSENQIRYEARWRHAVPDSTNGYLVQAEPRTGVPTAVGGRDALDRSALALAALAGYTGSWAQFGDDEIGVVADSATLTTIAVHTAGIFVLATIAFAFLGFVLGGVMSRHAMRRLSAVAEALERFARGDLGVSPIKTIRSDELGRLALAYNGAIEMVNCALAKRDRAEAQMRRLTADASHQLRTPLTVINGFISILRKDDFAKTTDVERALAMMSEQSNLMTSLIEKLLLLDRWDSGATTALFATDVAELVEDIVRPVVFAYPARDFHLVTAGPSFARIDADDVKQAVSNIVSNALAYAPLSPIGVTVTCDGATVSVTISDHGPGMDSRELDHVFDRFYRGRRRDLPGSGLGLAIARHAIERSGGTLHVKSELALGSTFLIKLPACQVLPEDVASEIA